MGRIVCAFGPVGENSRTVSRVNCLLIDGGGGCPEPLRGTARGGSGPSGASLTTGLWECGVEASFLLLRFWARRRPRVPGPLPGGPCAEDRAGSRCWVALGLRGPCCWAVSPADGTAGGPGRLGGAES